MEKANATTKVVVVWKSGESMKRLNNYFFGGPAHWTDYLWFYGSMLLIIWITYSTYIQIKKPLITAMINGT